MPWWWMVVGWFSAVVFVIIASFVYAWLYSGGLKVGRDSVVTHVAVKLGLHKCCMCVTTQVLILLRRVDWVMDRETQSIADGPHNALVLFGDSEFTYWHKASTDLSTNVVNAGFGGSRTSDLLRNVQVCLRQCPTTVILHVGGNDWDFRPWCTNTERLGIRAADNVVKLCRLLTKDNRRVAVLLTPRRPIYSDKKWTWLRRFRQRLRDTLPGSVEFIDCEYLDPQGTHFYLDQVHLNDRGHAETGVEMLKHPFFQSRVSLPPDDREPHQSVSSIQTIDASRPYATEPAHGTDESALEC
jgi:hypothetical protein